MDNISNGDVHFEGEVRLTRSQIQDHIKKLLQVRKNANDFPKLDDKELNEISRGSWIKTSHILHFESLLMKNSQFKPRGPQYVKNPEFIVPVNYNEKHVEILHSGTRNNLANALDGEADGHWVCCYYDTNSIIIYDSLNTGKLHPDHEIYLAALFPAYESRGIKILFKRVQEQRNGYDCGVFAIAFTVSIYFGRMPDNCIYNDYQMRTHLVNMLNKHTISHFPLIKTLNSHLSTHGNIINVVHPSINITIPHTEPTDMQFSGINPLNKKRKLQEHIAEWKKTKISNDIKKLDDNELDEISRGSWIKTSHILHFENILMKNSQFKPRGPHYVRTPQRIIPVDYNEKHIEILHSGTRNISGNRLDGEADGHWVCCYYDTNSIIIYDSLNTGKLHSDHEIYLNALFPEYESRGIKILFKSVQQQRNGSDCGIFAIAFAVSLYFERAPDTLFYNEYQIRQHLVTILRDRIISHFPLIKSINNEVSLIMTTPNVIHFDVTEEIIENLSDNRDRSSHITTVIKKNGKSVSSRPLKNLKQTVARKIIKKYDKIRLVLNDRKLLKSKQFFINQIIDQVDSQEPLAKRRVIANEIITICIYEWRSLVDKLRLKFDSCKRKVSTCLSRLDQYTNRCIMNDQQMTVRDKFLFLCGRSKHNKSTEKFVSVSSYYVNSHNPDIEKLSCKDQVDLYCNTSINSNEHQIPREGLETISQPLSQKDIKTEPNHQSNNILDEIEKKVWFCDEKCKLDDSDVFESLLSLFDTIHETIFKNSKKLLDYITGCSLREPDCPLKGHTILCYENPLQCNSKFLKLLAVRAHFPEIRTLETVIYAMIRFNREIDEIEKSLYSANLPKLKEIFEKSEIRKMQISNQEHKLDVVTLNEASIKKQFAVSYSAFLKRCAELPEFPCISCERLYSARDKKYCIEYQKDCMEDNEIWDQLMTEYEKKNSGPEYICDYCLTRIRKKQIPSMSILNRLKVSPIPKELADLNDIELLLIQRAKVFQTVQKLGTVMNRNVPHYTKADAIKGYSFHLPLPIEETLKKICPDTDPIMLEHELYILVRSLPNKSKMIWETLVDLAKVWRALNWLKTNNPLYHNINLPTFENRDKLLSGIKTPVEYVDSCDDQNINEKKKNPEAGDAMLTLKSQSDLMYKEYTIYPVHNKQSTESCSNLYQLLKICQEPLDFNVRDLDLRCFPKLFPYGENGMHEERPVNLRDYDFIRSRLLSKHPQFRRNKQYLFYLFNNHTMRSINAGIYQTMNVVNADKMTVNDFLRKLSKDELERNLNTIFSKLRNTKEYWSKIRNELNCMTDELGPATVFLTVSPGEWNWTDMGEYIKKFCPPEDKNKSVSELIILEPVLACIFIENTFQAILDFILSKDHPLGEVSYYFWRREYQGRGMQHFHLVLFVDDAPILDDTPENIIRKYILKHMTCKLPDRRISPELYRKVKEYQKHKHNNYCMRRIKKGVGFRSVCRFGFPRPKSRGLILKRVMSSIVARRKLKHNSRLYDLPRTVKEQYINDYNPAILLLWEGNTDIQAIGDSNQNITEYVCKYVTKTEKSNLNIEALQSSKSLCSKLWSLSIRSLSNRECGIFEVVDTLLSFSVYGKSKEIQFRWIDVRMKRNRKLKKLKEIKELPAESTDIFCDNIISHYSQRPNKLESTNLYSFAKFWDVVNKKPIYKAEYHPMPGSKNFCKKRKGLPYLIHHWKYNPEVDSEEENYYYSLLFLFKPWRNDPEDLINNSDTFKEAFNKAQIPNAIAYHNKYMEKLRILKENKKKQDEEMEKDTNEKSPDNCVPEGCIPIEVNEAMKEFDDYNDMIVVSPEKLKENIEKLNSDQKRILQKIQNAINNNEKVRMFISGYGGTGKSMLINTLVQWLLVEKKKKAAVVAPTGIAALNVHGNTIHRLLRLPVELGGTAKYKPLDSATAKLIRESLTDVELFILDEASMASDVTFMLMHLRLTEIFNTLDLDDGWFGNKNIVAFGDLLQLSPVRDGPIFKALPKEKVTNLIGCMGTYNLWDLFDYDELTVNMRQRSDKTYGDMLCRVRLGIITEDDIKILQSRQLNFKSKNINGRIEEICDYLLKLPPNTVCLLPKNRMCNIINKTMLTKLKSDPIELISIDLFNCSKNLRAKIEKELKDKDHDEDISRTAGLSRVIQIKIGCKIMIRRNIDVSLGLVNGSIATVVGIFRDEKNGIESLHIRLENGLQHQITRCVVKFVLSKNVFIIRKQFPICLSYAMSIHKSQGISIDNALMDIGEETFSVGQAYVALSRVRTLSGLHLINFNPAEIKADASVIREYNRLREKFRPDLKPIEKFNEPARKIKDRLWLLPKGISEVQNNIDQSIEYNFHGLPNNNGQLSSFNSVLQSLFNLRNVRYIINEFIDDTLFIIYNKYYRVDERYLDNLPPHIYNYIQRERNVVDIINEFCSKSAVAMKSLQFEHNIVIKCNKCSYREESLERKFILKLLIPPSCTKTTLQDIINYNFDWKPSKIKCPKCKQESISQVIKDNIVMNQSIVLFLVPELDSDYCDKKFNNSVKIKSAVQNNIVLAKKKLKVNGVILRQNKSGKIHYTSMLRKNKTNKWIKINDDSLEIDCSWPKLAKDVYIYFLEEETSKTDSIAGNFKFNKRPMLQRTSPQKDRSSIVYPEEHEKLKIEIPKIGQFRGLPNPNIFCYANSILQCIFFSKIIRSEIEKNIFDLPILKNLYNNYVSGRTVDVLHFRKSIGGNFGLIEQQCVAEFLEAILDTSNQLSNLLRFSLLEQYHCPECKHTTFKSKPDTILKLTIPKNIKSILTLQDLINHHDETEEKLFYLCDEVNRINNQPCSSIDRIKRVKIFAPSTKILVIQLVIFDTDEDLNTTKITGHKFNDIQNNKYLIGDNWYKVISVILHEGGTTEGGHYQAVLRNDGDTWTRINDSIVISNHKWCMNKGDPYLLFLEQLGPSASNA